MIYLIVDYRQNVCKIGYSNDPERRLANLQVGNPYPLELAGVIDGDIFEEKALHSRFKERQLKGEWFEICPEILKHFSVDRYIYTFDSWTKTIKFLSRSALRSVLFLVFDCQYNTNLIKLDSVYIQKLSEKMDIGTSAVRNSVTNLCENGVLLKVERCVYRINPKYFWNGVLEERIKLIRKLKDQFTLIEEKSEE